VWPLRRALCLEHPAIGPAGLAAPRLPLAAFSSVNNLYEVASLLGPCQGLPGTAAHYPSAPTAAHSYASGSGTSVGVDRLKVSPRKNVGLVIRM
jgi:hypothetical protein